MHPDLARRQRQMMRRRMARQILTRRLRERGERGSPAPTAERKRVRQ